MPELRRDPITRGWGIVAPERQRRPSDFFTQTSKKEAGHCPFCSINDDGETKPLQRFSGSTESGKDWEITVIPDKYPLLNPEESHEGFGDGMYDLLGGYGHHELVIESNDHFACFESMSLQNIEGVFSAYQQRMIQLAKDTRVSHVLITRNTGHYAGANIHHPHSHIVGLPIVPKKIFEEMEGAGTYFDYRERCLFCDIIAQETEEQTRVVMEDEHFIAFCPYASRFPFEVTIMPKTHQAGFETINSTEIESLAKHVKSIFKGINSLLGTPPLNYIIHSAPFSDCGHKEFEKSHSFFHWHIEILPKLTRIAGFEWGSGFYINPMLPEEAAEHIREELNKT